MTLETPPSNTSPLDDAILQFKTWRETRTKRGRIPESLWDVAVKLCIHNGYSLHKVSRSLSLGHAELKKRISREQPGPLAAKPYTPAFIELGLPQSETECIVEMESSGGSKMRMCFKGKPDPQLVGLGHSFLRAQP